MKFALASDLHLAYGTLFIDNTENADILILAGDIYEATSLPPKENEYHYVRTFFRHVAKQFRYVLWVAGNHEHWGTSFPTAHSLIGEFLRDDPELKNVRFLERDTFFYDGVCFHGTTLWTDLKRGDPLVMGTIRKAMKDFHKIEGWTPSLQYDTFYDSLKWIENSLSKNAKNVVITHHHPCSLSIDYYAYRPTDISNFGYFSELSEFIMDHPEISFWCCGHIHTRKYYNVDNTYVVCNPRGYKGYENELVNSFKLEYYEL